MRFLLLSCIVAASIACHPGPIIDTSPKPSVGGTIAGIVSASDGKSAVPGRKVTAINVATGARFAATTAQNGGYTIQVPEGTYRIDIELREGETLAKRPDPTKVNNSDLDPGRDFVITVAKR